MRAGAGSWPREAGAGSSQHQVADERGKPAGPVAAVSLAQHPAEPGAAAALVRGQGGLERIGGQALGQHEPAGGGRYAELYDIQAAAYR